VARVVIADSSRRSTRATQRVDRYEPSPPASGSVKRKHVDISDEERDEILGPQGGFRLVDTAAMLKFFNKGCPRCGPGGLQQTKDATKGLQSTITYRCSGCNGCMTFTTSPNAKPQGPGCPPAEVNIRAVLGLAGKGNHFTSLERFTSTMNMPGMSHGTWDSTLLKIGDVVQRLADDAVRTAHMDEARYAKQRGVLPDKYGYYHVACICDGTWAKRSKRAGSGNSKLGAAFLMRGRAILWALA